MNNFNAIGKVVYLAWYDFDKKSEYICSGEVVDNSDYAGTQWADYVNVSFCPPGFKQPICHHFLPEKLSVHSDKVPHDDCYLVCGRKSRAYEHDYTVKQQPQRPSDSWQQVQQFKQEHWDYQHGHLSIDALNDFYRLWRIAVAARYGVTIEEAPVTVVAVDPGSPDGDKSATIIVDTETGEILPKLPAEVEHRPIVSEERYQELKEKMKVKLTKKQKNSTGRIEYTDSIQTSLFD